MVEDACADRGRESRHRVHGAQKRAGVRSFLGDETERLGDVVVDEDAERRARVEPPPRAPEIFAGDLGEVERAGQRLAQCEDRADLGVANGAVAARYLEGHREAIEDDPGDEADAQPHHERDAVDGADESLGIGQPQPGAAQLDAVDRMHGEEDDRGIDR